MHQDFAELTVTAVDSLFGQLTSRVYACLAYLGRCKAQDVVKETRLTPRQVGATLVVLVQHHLAYHYTDDIGQTFYEANGDTAYNIVFRYGKLAKAVRASLGAVAAEVITKIALLGHTTPTELQREWKLGDTPKHSSKIVKPTPRINGVLPNHSQKPKADVSIFQGEDKSSIKTINELHTTLNTLLLHGYICLTTEHQFMIRSDLHVEAEHITRHAEYTGGTVKGGKEKLELEHKVNERKRLWRDAADAYSFAASSNKESKKPRLSLKLHNGVNGVSSSQGQGADAPYFRLGDDILVQLNFEKCNVIMRNQQLVSMAHRFLGETTSKVYEVVLKLHELHILRCFDPFDDRNMLESETEDSLEKADLPSSSEILQNLPDDVDLSDGLPSATNVNGPNGHSSSRPLTVSDDSSSSDSDIPSRQTRPQKKIRATNELLLLERHLQLLQNDPRRFVRSEGNVWAIPFKRLTRSLIQYQIENTVLALHGQWAVRIIRILHKMYSTEEKTLVNSAILKPKDVRSILNTLIAAGLVDTQEIPRDTNRTTNRLLWLYVYSPERARKRIIRDSYRAMTRLLCRLEVERESRASTIDKSERTDVIGQEDKYLSEKDKNVLGEWNKMEERVWCQVERIDDLVACMRDFAPIDDPYIGNRARVAEETEE